MKGLKKLSAVLMALVILLGAACGPGFTAAFVDLPASYDKSKDGDVTPTEPIPEIPTEAPTEAPTEEPTEPTVGQVTNLVRTTGVSNLCGLQWDPVEGADGYYVYVSNADENSDFTRVATVPAGENTYTVQDLKQATQYWFRVSAFAEYNGTVIEGEPGLRKTATYPEALTGLTKMRSSNVNEMSWTRNAAADGYQIFRTSPESGNKEVLYKTISGSANTSFADTAVTAGRVYTYRVCSYRSLYGAAYRSPMQSMSFVAGLGGPNFTIASRCQRVNLTWAKNPYAAYYVIWWSTGSEASSFEKLYTTENTFYNTLKLTNNATYWFRVQPVYKKGGTVIEGTAVKKSVKVTATAYGAATGGTYVEVSIDHQHLWAFKNGKMFVSTSVVTGNQGDSDTPKGYFYIQNKVRSTYLVGPTWYNYVDYWVPFYGAYGLHDSSWRSAYGGTIYQGDGSHGCVNTPKASMGEIFNNLPVGTPVIIY